MATITLRNVPDDLHRRLKERAARNRRSLNGEAIRCLEAAVRSEAPEKTTLLARIRRRREELAESGVWVTSEDVARAIEAGRDEALP